MPPGNERFGEAEEQIVDVIALLTAVLQHVAEPTRRYEPEGGTAAFDDGVGDEGRSVHDLVDVAQGDAGGLRQRPKA